MRPWRIRPERQYGACGYPMVQATLAGVELLGGLTLPGRKDFDPNSGQEYFIAYWQEWLYSTGKKRDLGAAIYKLARHGLAHVFLAKPGIAVLKDAQNGKARHLTLSPERELQIDALTLSHDFKNSVQALMVKSRRGGTLLAHMQARLDAMADRYGQQSRRVQAQFFGGLPRTDFGRDVIAPSGTIAISSQTLRLAGDEMPRIEHLAPVRGNSRDDQR